MKTVAEILKGKGREVWTITPETIVFDALKTMADKNVGALVVLDGTTVAASCRNGTTPERLSCMEDRQESSRREKS